MVTEDYVSFETAKLLKEKWFDEECNTVYSEYGELHEIFDKEFYESTNSFITLSNSNYNDITRVKYRFFVTAPTLQMAMKWFREVHHYYIQIMLDSWACGGHTGYYVVIQKTDSDFEMMLQDAVDEVFYQTYEEAAEAAIRYIINDLI